MIYLIYSLQCSDTVGRTTRRASGLLKTLILSFDIDGEYLMGALHMFESSGLHHYHLISCCVKIQNGLSFSYRLTWAVLENWPLKDGGIQLILVGCV